MRKQETKKLLSFWLCAGLATLPNLLQASVTSVAWYRLGEADSGAASGAVINATSQDSVGTNHLKRAGSPIYTSNVSNLATNSVLGVQFNGTDQFLTNDVILSMATDNFGMEAWVKPASTNVNIAIVYNGDQLTGNGWAIWQKNDRYEGLWGGDLLTGGTATPGTWSHVAIVRNQGTNILYINGTQVASLGPVGSPEFPTHSFTIGGAAQVDFPLFYPGAVDEVRVFTFTAGQFSTNDLLINRQRSFGVDVSHFQGETGIAQANWNQLFSEGKRFAFIKATEGISVIDSTMPINMNRATAAGLRVGVYHFAHPEIGNDPVQEADFLLTQAGNFIGPGYLRPVLDLETGSGLSTNALTDWVIAFGNEIVARRGAGAAPIIYTLQSFAINKLDSRIANYDLWIRFPVSFDPSTNDPPIGVFNNWCFWQFKVGSAGGISPLDLNICHDEFKPLDSFLIPQMPNPVAPAIATQPISRTVRLGKTATFSVGSTVSSSTPLSYQWRLEGTNVAGATGSAYSLTNAQLPNAGAYMVVITNAAGSITSAVARLAVINPPPTVPGVVLWQENFDGYGSPASVTTPATTNGFTIFFNATTGPFDFSARFGFDYSTVSSPTRIPSAPHSSGGTTKGLFLTVNKDVTSAVTGVNLYPVSQNFTGTFALKFDLWINYPNSGTATEHALFGINHSAAVTNCVGLATSDGLFFAMDGDGGVSAGSASIRDFAIFRGGGPVVAPVLLTMANTTFGPEPPLGANFDNADAGLAALFPSKTLSFATVAGSAGNGWVSVEVRQTTNLITWLLNDTIIAQYANSTAFTSGDVLFGYQDNFSSPGGVDNFAVFDNLRVETIPDVDGNGIADAWEIQYFNRTGVDPDADADGDGVSNLNEYYAGTNPTNAASRFQLISAIRTNNDVRLDWAVVGGHSYVVQLSTNVGASFFDISPVISVGGVGESITNFVHVGAGVNSLGFYRVRLGP